MDLKQLTALNWTLKKIEGDELIEVRRKHDGLLIADVYGIGYARLITSAPELLEALELAVKQNQRDMLLTGEELRQCEAVIAKARGEK